MIEIFEYPEEKGFYVAGVDLYKTEDDDCCNGKIYIYKLSLGNNGVEKDT